MSLWENWALILWRYRLNIAGIWNFGGLKSLLIQQSCISNTLIEQSPHIAYAIVLKIIILKGSRNLNDKKIVKQVSGS